MKTNPRNTKTTVLARITSASLAAFACLSALADKAAYDGFELSDTGSLDGQIGGTGFAEAYVANEAATVITRNLVYRNGDLLVDGGRQALQLRKSADATQHVQFSRRLSDIHDGVFYISALVFVDRNTKSSGNRDTVTLGLSAESGGRPHGGLGIEDTAYKWTAFIGTQGRLSSIVVEADKTHLLVARVYKTSASGPYNRVDLMVNPDSAEEPATWTLTNQTPGGSTGTTATEFGYLSFFMHQDRAEANDTFLFDEIRVGTTWSDVVVPSVEKTTASETVEWSGASEVSDNWSETENWSDEKSPVGNDAIFGLANVSSDGTPNSVVSESMAVNSLVFGNLAAENDMTKRQIIRIPAGTTLTVDGTNATGRAFAVSAVPSSAGTWEARVGFTGGGALSVASPDGTFIAGEGYSSPGSTRERAFLDFSGLSSFSANVSRFLIGYGVRTRGEMKLAATGAGVNEIRADYVAIGDSAGVLGGPETALLELGPSNVIYAARINVAATEVSGSRRNNAESGILRFAPGFANPYLKIRSRGGARRADMTIASHGDGGDNWYYLSGSADFSGGTVDMMLGELLIAAGAGYTGTQSGAVDGHFTMEAGRLDVDKLSVGRTCIFAGGRKLDTHPAWGRFTMLGGEAVVNRAIEVGVSTNGSWKGGFQFAKGDIALSGDAHLTAAGSVVLASDQGYATGVVARVTIGGNATFDALGGICNGIRYEGRTDNNVDIKIAEFDGSVFVNGGLLAVTNDTQTSEFRLDYGTLSVAGGSVMADKLTMTNSESVVSILISGRDAPIVVNGAANVEGASLSVRIDNDNPPAKTGSYKLIQAQTLTGAFSDVTLPQGVVKLVYTDNSVSLCYGGTVVLLR